MLLLVATLPEAAHACPICFGATDSPLVDAARLGVLAMAAVTIGVLTAFGAWFVRLAKLESTIHNPRSRSAADDQQST